MYVPEFFVKQRITMLVNRYEVLAPGPDGQPGQMLAFAQQKRLALKEKVTFYSDDTQTRPVFSFAARQVVDLGAQYDVFDEYGQPIGYIKKVFGASLLRSTFEIAGPGYQGRGHEENEAVALLRRFTELDFLPVHFAFTSEQGEPLMRVRRQFSLRDKYTVTVPDQRVDFRVAAAMGVALDVLMSR
ncbi:LURP-one-related/scramblase family protein [Aestuariimicrobium ganziense]|uniref:hypothetical protein n=1 Tax=Aestuariimicrobium ganziense TaxID=2773677 RepID=UPI00194371BE|nr:hypothetical protein [Aestuariimicrobium ganziense]